jgi:hypothetical protein
MGMFKWKNEELFQITMEEMIQLAKLEEAKLGRALTQEELYAVYAQGVTSYRLNAKRPILKPSGIFSVTFVTCIVGIWLTVAFILPLFEKPKLDSIPLQYVAEEDSLKVNIVASTPLEHRYMVTECQGLPDNAYFDGGYADGKSCLYFNPVHSQIGSYRVRIIARNEYGCDTGFVDIIVGARDEK